MRTLRSLFIIFTVIIVVALLGGCSAFEPQHPAVHDHHDAGHDHLDANHHSHNADTAHGGSVSAHHLFSYGNTDDHDRVARHDMASRAAQSLPRSTALPETFGCAEAWSADWELRWIDYETPSGIVRVYHATSRHGGDVRYISHWAHDEARYHEWQPIH
jgi:hypothetical protein